MKVHAVVSHWPVVYLPTFFAVVTLVPSVTTGAWFPLVFAIHWLSIVGGLLTTVWFALDVGHDDRLDSAQRLLWFLILLMGNLLVLPLYYWMRIHPWPSWSEAA